MRNTITCNRPLPLYDDCSQEERSDLNDPVISRYCIERYLTYAEARAYRLPPDVRADNQRWVTSTDHFSRRRRDLLMELIATNLSTNHLVSFPTLLAVYHTTGE